METFLMFIKAFLVGGGICLVGQIIINWTHLTNGKILVLFLIAGAVLEGFGLYSPLVEFAGAGASVPISGFGCALVKGAVESAKSEGFYGALKGGLAACATGISIAIISGYLVSVVFRPRTKKK
ncbi:MAG: stage V sporulation protein AE [Corallococcus sp.]|nr:stage V sporulation protein AE [Corallococcus sp.]MCM1359184.1 stage V sporulation protein AE [Corallococcus sp.]MCM1394574.1 stage V sporulation protein AE [Corallococcus sp.]